MRLKFQHFFVLSGYFKSVLDSHCRYFFTLNLLVIKFLLTNVYEPAETIAYAPVDLQTSQKSWYKHNQTFLKI